MKKETQDTRSWVSLLFAGLIVLVVVASGGAAYAIFSESDSKPKRAKDERQLDERADQAGQARASEHEAQDRGATSPGDNARAFARVARAMAEEPPDEDEQATWKRAPWDENAAREKAAPSRDWTPKGIAALDPQGLVESIRGERNPTARRKLMQELLSRGLSSQQVAGYVQDNPAAIVDVIRTEQNDVSRARLAEQLSEVELPQAAREDTAVELLLMPDGSLKLTAMEMLLSEPDSALSRLKERQGSEQDPEKLEVIESAIQYFQEKEQAR